MDVTEWAKEHQLSAEVEEDQGIQVTDSWQHYAYRLKLTVVGSDGVSRSRSGVPWTL